MIFEFIYGYIYISYFFLFLSFLMGEENARSTIYRQTGEINVVTQPRRYLD